MRDFTKHLRLFLASLVAAAWLAVIAAPAALAGQHSTAGLARAIAAQELYTADLMAIPGVVGTAVGLAANGDPVVKIYTAAGGIAGLPATLDGVGVRIEVTGEFFALHHVCDHFGGPPGSDTFPCDGDPPPDGGDIDPKARFDRPVPIGVSSGTTESIEQSGIFISCSTGTLGARLSGGGKVYALSNNHIYAEEGMAEIGAAGRIVQPGPADNDPVCGDGSLDDPSDSIGELAAFVPIVFSTSASNRSDAAIAETTTDDVGTATPSDGYGTPTSTLAACGDCFGEDVQKYGRTTGLKKGTVSGINATIFITYSAGTARFVDQIVVSGSKGPFIKGGDSGSLLVTDPGNAPVGLLFAGSMSGKTAIANRISDVLGELSGLVSGTLSVDGN